VKTKLLKAALTKIKPFTAARSTLPVLQNVALWTKDGTLWMEATNLEIACKMPVGYVDGCNGPDIDPCTVEYKALAGITQNWDEDINFAVEGSALNILSHDGKKATLRMTIPYADFPSPNYQGENIGYLYASTLNDAAVKVAPSAMRPNGERPILENVMMQLRGEEARFVSADGIELVVLEVGAPHSLNFTQPAEPPQLFVPATAFKPLAGLADNPASLVQVATVIPKEGPDAGYPTVLCLRYANDAVASVRLMGTSLGLNHELHYPDWTIIIPKDLPKVGYGSSESLLKALKSLKPITDTHKNEASFWWFTTYGVNIVARSYTGEGMQTVHFRCWTNRKNNIALDASRVRGLLSRAGTMVTFSVAEDRMRPILIEDEIGWKAVLMPLNVQDTQADSVGKVQEPKENDNNV